MNKYLFPFFLFFTLSCLMTTQMCLCVFITILFLEILTWGCKLHFSSCWVGFSMFPWMSDIQAISQLREGKARKKSASVKNKVIYPTITGSTAVQAIIIITITIRYKKIVLYVLVLPLPFEGIGSLRTSLQSSPQITGLPRLPSEVADGYGSWEETQTGLHNNNDHRGLKAEGRHLASCCRWALWRCCLSTKHQWRGCPPDDPCDASNAPAPPIPFQVLINLRDGTI